MAFNIQMLISIFCLFFSIFTTIYADKNDRSLTYDTLCENSENENFNLIHVTAVGKEDSLHFIYSSIGSFVILSALTPPNASLSVNCLNLTSGNTPGSIKFDNSPIYSFAIVFSNLYEFYDKNDDVDISKIPADNITEIPIDKFVWDKVQIVNKSNDIEISFNVSDSSAIDNSTGRLMIKLSNIGSTGRSADLPHLVHSGNSTQIEFTLDHFPILYKKPRFAVELLLIGMSPETGFSLTSSRSLDDEFTPGVFELIQLWSSSVEHGKPGAFAQWKPTVYTSKSHARVNSTKTVECCLQTYNLSQANESFTNSLAAAFYTDLKKNFAQSVKITFGMEGDSFYSSTNYSSWTLAVGYGTPPEDKISTLIIIVIAIGLGVPFLLLIAGGGYMLVKRCRRRNDDLLLSE